MRGAKRGLVLAALLAALVLAACGSSGSSGSKSSTSSHSSTAASNGVASKSPTEILDAAVAAAESAGSMHVSGTVTQQGTIGLDLDLVTGKGAAGTISQGAPKFKLIVVGRDFFFQGNRAFWLHAAHSQAAVQLLLGKWIRYPSAGAQFGSVSHLTSIKAVMDAIVREHGTLSKGQATTIAGQPAIVLDDSNGGRLYVATTGKPYPLKLIAKRSAGGVVSFTQYGHPFAIAAPKHSIDATQLQKAGA
jgi:hypothetical protein